MTRGAAAATIQPSAPGSQQLFPDKERQVQRPAPARTRGAPLSGEEGAGADVYLFHLPIARGEQAGTALCTSLPPPSPTGQKALSGWRGAMSRFLNVLRSWLMMTSIIAAGHSLQSFRDHTFLYENIYTGKPDLGRTLLNTPACFCCTVNGLQARTFGVWTLLSPVVRCLCAIDIHNKTLYYITLWTFFITTGHILFELFVFGTAAPTTGIMAPLMVASVSILGMLVGLQHLEAEPGSRQKKRN
ncbi:ergosterol biosynthetic protein 28 homolog [Bos javanicus]|uniref:ergosterol biosynthetic protein 28 homolog n=1 Tax=Bos javanicus TaxID=9906 RepID=UPI002AA76690|nr:ergosterol biosynthetic protein 28 homolog [Bos javanicus]